MRDEISKRAFDSRARTMAMARERWCETLLVEMMYRYCRWLDADLTEKNAQVFGTRVVPQRPAPDPGR